MENIEFLDPNQELRNYVNQLEKTENYKLEEERYIGEKIMYGIASETPYMYNGEIIGYPFNLEKFIKKFGKDFIPNKLGIYHLFYHDHLVYVGMSKNIKTRLLQHLKDKDMPFHNVMWFMAEYITENATIEEVLEVEYNMIKTFKPSLNLMYTNSQ